MISRSVSGVSDVITPTNSPVRASNFVNCTSPILRISNTVGPRWATKNGPRGDRRGGPTSARVVCRLIYTVGGVGTQDVDRRRQLAVGPARVLELPQQRAGRRHLRQQLPRGLDAAERLRHRRRERRLRRPRLQPLAHLAAAGLPAREDVTPTEASAPPPRR